MSKKSGFWTVLALALVLLLSWHFLIKPYNYRISFVTKDPAGLVYSNLGAWLAIPGETDSSSVELISRVPYESYQQKVRLKDSLFEYRWEIEPQSDSTTKVTAYITDLKNTWVQNFYAPVYKTDFVKRSIKTVEDLATEWVNYRERYRVNEITEGQVDARFCAYVSVKTTAKQKARTMMGNIADVMGYINTNELELQGDPFLQVTRWDQKTDSISFDFCFPIKPSDSLVASPIVKFKEVQAFSGIKTIFNGNYSISEKSWYWLLRAAENRNLEVEALPFEVYKSDPHMGGDALKWEAEIYLPFKNQ
ncbi:hypothetical protein [Gilvibacter sp.]|uniref:hypothetical protein n=1 Tax=Gilvibacter sp. TaxID=2729997 RepID=UPI0025BA0B73|nr:hypothetical protein [Gilvibacter sp.]NQX76996.1 hypothetical protein [Gilvibacter sp.]